ncbi:MAG: NADH-quinone oxidoreductase subunit [Campylobacterota bacterium]|nr:NADH-quinone oxidoreductase subunit [Campylobacterota bacterium]
MIKDIKIISKKYHIKESNKLEVALKHGAYSAIKRGFEIGSNGIYEEVNKSGLRGKGGGGAPAGAKWKLLLKPDARPKYLVVNSDESEPGTFKDRTILEKDPHLLIEGIILTCYAIGANNAYVYIRGEYAMPAKILQNAIDEAYNAGILGKKVMGYDFSLDVTIHRGAGAYICGEKSALLESLEGKRGHPRLKPKGKEPEWYFGNPTLVNNVETIASVPFIVENTGDEYKKYGTSESPGTLLFGISGHVNNPGIYEAPFGTPMIDYINEFAGGVRGGKKLKAVIPGGSSCAVLTADEVKKATLDYETMQSLGSSLGTGGMIVMDEDTDMVAVLKNLMGFYHHESCGQCTPCREGTGWIDRTLEKIIKKEGTEDDIKILLKTADTMNGKTICVFAPAVSTVVYNFIKKFRSEFENYLGQKNG